MGKRDDTDGFFVGYINRLPGALRWFVPLSAVIIVIVFAALGALTAAVQTDPGDGRFLWDAGEISMSGVLEADPYPIVHIAPNERFPKGRTLMLNGEGKRGVQDQARGLQGKAVNVSGFLLKRGTLDMLQVAGDAGLRAATGTPPIGQRLPEHRNLGRWRLTGELCDGKCFAGAMRPGTGLAHKACANLCITGGLPPVFVSSGPVEGRTFMLVADENGGPMPREMFDRVAILIEAEGLIEERGDLLIFKIDRSTIKVL